MGLPTENRLYPDPKKQGIEVCFSRKIESNNPSPLTFNQSQFKISESHKHLGLILDTKFEFNEHPEDKSNKCNRIIGSIKKLSLLLPRTCLLTIYKVFVRPHLDYPDMIYDKPDNESFKDWLEKVQYNPALAITGVIRGTSQKRIYNKLALESLADGRWYRKMIFFYKIVKNPVPKYLQSYLLPQMLNQYTTRCAKKNLLPALPSRTPLFRNTFFPYCINEWNKLNDNVRNANSIYKFKNYLNEFIKVKENSTFSISDPLGLNLLIRLLLNFSQPNEDKFRHNYRGTVNPMYSCGARIETTDHYLLRCQILLLSDRVSSTESLKLMFNSEI